MPVIMLMKIGTVPYGPMRVKYKKKRPKIGDRVLVQPVDEPHSKWISVIIDKYNPDGYCFASKH